MKIFDQYNLLEQRIKSFLPPDVTLHEEKLQHEFMQLQDGDSSWLIKLVTLLGGFLGASFVLGLIMSIVGFASATFTFITACIMLGTVLWASRRKDLLILDGIFVTLYLPSFFVLDRAFTIWQLKAHLVMEWVILFISLLTIITTRSFILNFLAVLVGNGCLLFMIENHKLQYLFHLLFLLQWGALLLSLLLEPQWMLSKKFWQYRFKAFRYALFSSITISTFLLTPLADHIVAIPLRSMSAIVPIGLIGFAIFRGFDKLKFSYGIWWALLVVGVLAFTLQAPYLVCCLLLLLLSFGFSERIFLIISIMAFIYSIGQFYYDIEYTLLIKSLCLMGSGMVLGAIYFFSSSKLISDDPS